LTIVLDPISIPLARTWRTEPRTSANVAEHEPDVNIGRGRPVAGRRDRIVT
jgi:hypothetical protein